MGEEFGSTMMETLKFESDCAFVKLLMDCLNKPKMLIELLAQGNLPPSDIDKLLMRREALGITGQQSVQAAKNFIINFYSVYGVPPLFIVTSPQCLENFKADFPIKGGPYYVLFNSGGASIFNSQYNMVSDAYFSSDSPMVNGIYVKNSNTDALEFFTGFQSSGMLDVRSVNLKFAKVDGADFDFKLSAFGIQPPKKNKPSPEEPLQKKAKTTEATTDLINELMQNFTK